MCLSLVQRYASYYDKILHAEAGCKCCHGDLSKWCLHFYFPLVFFIFHPLGASKCIAGSQHRACDKIDLLQCSKAFKAVCLNYLQPLIYLTYIYLPNDNRPSMINVFSAVFGLPRHIHMQPRKLLLIKVPDLWLDFGQSLSFMCFVRNKFKWKLQRKQNIVFSPWVLTNGSLNILLDALWSL